MPHVNKWRSALLLLAAGLIVLLSPAPGWCTEVKPALDRAAGYLLAKEKADGQPLSPWSYAALAAAGKSLAGTGALKACEKQFAELQSGELNNYSLLVITLLAAGANPFDYREQNLVQKIKDAQLADGKFADNADGSGLGDDGEQALLNSHVWAVLALHSSGTDFPGARRAKQWLIERQHADGGFNWNLANEKSDADSTAMALLTLGALGDKEDSPAVQKAVAYLKDVQENCGGFSSWGALNPESCAMVISGLTAVGIDPAREDWNSPGGNPVTAMLAYQLPGGAFEHARGGGVNNMATEQALLALSDIYCGNTLYDRLRNSGASALNPGKGDISNNAAPAFLP